MVQQFSNTPFLLEMDKGGKDIRAHNQNCHLQFELEFALPHGKIKFQDQAKRSLAEGDMDLIKDHVKEYQKRGQPAHCLIDGEVDTIKLKIRVFEIRIS